MKKEKWMLAAKRADFYAIGKQFHISPVLARLIRNRDIGDPEEIRQYLYGSMEDLPDPCLLKDVDKGAEVIRKKILEGRRIRIISDYDVDGISSNYILYRGLQRCKAQVDYRIPDRVEDGYGINEQLIRQAYEDGIDTIITCDNGIAAIDQVAYGNSLGMAFVITDHHDVPFDEDPQEAEARGRQIDLSGEESKIPDSQTRTDRVGRLPQAAAVINPKQADCPYPNKNICGAVVAWKFIQVLYSYFGYDRKETEEFLQIAALATICDVMPLKGENRIIVKEGLAQMNRDPLPGIHALIQGNKLEGGLKAWHLGFIIGPCLNASGRLSTARQALGLLLCLDPSRCRQLAGQLIALNEERKELTRKGVDAARKWLEESGHDQDKVLVIYLPDCHESIAGIIAGRIKEEYYKPVFVLTKTRQGVKGSGRSVEAYHMFREMTAVKECFDRFGGHPMAAGLSMQEERIGELRDKLNARTSLTEEDLTEKVLIDIALPLEVLNEDLIREFDKLEPFGTGNPRPLFAQKDLRILRLREMGKGGKALKVYLRDKEGHTVEAVYFGGSDRFYEDVAQAVGQEELQRLKTGQSRLTMACTWVPQINEWKGRKSIQLVIKHYGMIRIAP